MTPLKLKTIVVNGIVRSVDYRVIVSYKIIRYKCEGDILYDHYDRP